MTASASAPRPFQIVAAVIGNALEWYDFIIFGSMTPVISRLFFPAESQYAELLLTTAAFGVGFLMRPVGGVLLGIYADRKGRKAALLLVIWLMTAAIAVLALAPTYAAIGVAAPLIVVLARLLQGFATGGEFASATTLLIESAPPQRRGFYGSWQMVGQGLAVLTGAVLGTLLLRNLSPSALDSFGWRIPFLFGLVIGPIGLYIRRHSEETEAFSLARKADAEGQFRDATTLADHGKEASACIGVVTAATISFYVILLYMPTFARTELDLPLEDAFLVQAISLAWLVVLTPLFGALSDRIGRRPIMMAALGLQLALVYPLFRWVHQEPSFERLLIMQIILCGLIGAYFGPMSTALAEQFPARMRATGLAAAYNIAVMVFGGFAQTLVISLIALTGSPIAPSLYVMFGAAIGLAGTFLLVDLAGAANTAGDTAGIEAA